MAKTSTKTDDLRGIVQHLRPTRGGAPKDPNDPLVGQLLECAIEILTEAYLNVTHQPPGKFARLNDFMAPVSRKETAKKFNAKHQVIDLSDGDGKQTFTPRKIHTYWNSTAEFHDDVLNYLYRPGVHRARMVEYHKTLPELLKLPFKDFVRTVAESELRQLDTDNTMRIQTALPVLFPNHEQLRNLSSRTTAEQRDAWVDMYTWCMGTYRIEMIPGRTLRDFQYALNVAVIGHLPRVKMSPDLLTLSSGESLLVSMIQDILCAYTGLPWVELADRMPTNDIDLR